MTAPWPSEEARDLYVRFLELELAIMKNASLGTVDPAVLAKFSSLLGEHFPRTMLYMESKLSGDVAEGLTEEIRAFAWAEARALPDESGQARVCGSWTETEIARDMDECFRQARARAGM